MKKRLDQLEILGFFLSNLQAMFLTACTLIIELKHFVFLRRAK